MNYTDVLKQENAVSSRLANLALVVGCSWLIALSAQYAIQLPFSPVPITGQTLIVLLAGLVLGKKRAAAAVGLYLLQGIAGLPFFAGGRSGLGILIGPTGGYLVGFIAAAYTVGMLSEIWHKPSPWQSALALLVGNVLIYLFGLVWLARLVGEAQVLQLGLYPFLVGDLLKLMIGISLIWGSSTLTKSFPGSTDR